KFYQMSVLARAKGFGLGWASTMEIRQQVSRGAFKELHYAWGSTTGYSVKPRDSVDIRLRPEQVIKGRFLDLQGIAAKVTFRVAAVLGDRPQAKGGRHGTMAANFRGMGRFDLYQRRQAGFSFTKTPAPKDLPLWPKPVTTDEKGRFELRGFGRDQDVEVLVE